MIKVSAPAVEMESVSSTMNNSPLTLSVSKDSSRLLCEGDKPGLFEVSMSAKEHEMSYTVKLN